MKQSTLKRWMIRVLALVILLGSTAQVQAQQQTKFRIDGASLFFSLVEPWTKAYGTQAPSCPAELLGSKTGKGYRGWIAGDVDIVAASRRLTADEAQQVKAKGIEPEEKPLGQVALAVVVNSKNPVNALTLEQLRKIFVGQITNWKEVGGPDMEITVTTRAVPETGAGVVFQRKVLGGDPYVKGSLVMPLYSTTAKIVGNKKEAIGYIPTTDPAFARRGLKELGVKTDENSEAVKPPEGAIKETTYPVTIPFLLVWNAKSPKAKCLQGFADFAAAQVK